ncbi:hypothetical protein [Mycobacterium sp. IS-1742]|uniref:hypothetical protein n=1 Tax=Mycobacterium sp. IS-1742 TaxID=1772285 RepID=UPI00336BC9F8
MAWVSTASPPRPHGLDPGRGDAAVLGHVGHVRIGRSGAAGLLMGPQFLHERLERHRTR